MIKQPLSARVSSTILSDAKARAELENVSLSAIVEAALTQYLISVPSVFAQPSNKPGWAVELETRVSKLESAQSSGEDSRDGREGKRRR